MKIVIATHEKYAKPLTYLITQLSLSDVPPQDIIIIVAGSGSDEPPAKTSMSQYNPNIPNNKVCIVIYTQLNNWEYTSYNTLNTYISDELVRDESYIILHDTCTLESDFNSRYHMLKNHSFPINTSWLYTVQDGVFNNIALVNNKLIESIGNNFDCELPKNKGVRLESGTQVELNGRTVFPLIHFGHKYSDTKKQKGKPKDVYETGYPRLPMLFPLFGIKKWIFHMQEGDFHGNIKPIINWRRA